MISTKQLPERYERRKILMETRRTRASMLSLRSMSVDVLDGFDHLLNTFGVTDHIGGFFGFHP